MDKVTALTLKCSTNILESELDENKHALKETKSSQLQNQICNPNILNHNGMKNHEYILDYRGKENDIPPVNFTRNKNMPGDNENPRNKNLQHTTQTLNKVYCYFRIYLKNFGAQIFFVNLVMSQMPSFIY